MLGILFILYLMPVAALAVFVAILLIVRHLVVVKRRKPPDWNGITDYFQQLPTLFNWRRKVLNDLPDIFWWWELRRIPFNILVGVAGLFSSAIFWVGAAQLAHQKNWAFGYVLESLVYWLGANICFTGGWILEGILKVVAPRFSDRLGSIAFISGVIFSLILTLVIPPIILVLIYKF